MININIYIYNIHGISIPAPSKGWCLNPKGLRNWHPNYHFTIHLAPRKEGPGSHGLSYNLKGRGGGGFAVRGLCYSSAGVENKNAVGLFFLGGYRWWQLKSFLSWPLFGEIIEFDEHIFQMGWNHQLGGAGVRIELFHVWKKGVKTCQNFSYSRDGHQHNNPRANTASRQWIIVKACAWHVPFDYWQSPIVLLAFGKEYEFRCWIHTKQGLCKLLVAGYM